MSMLRSLSDLFAQSTLRRSPPEYPPHVANAKIAKSCQKRNKIFILFHFGNHRKQICAAAAAPLGEVIHHSMHSQLCHAIFLHPSQKPIQRTIKIEALLLHIDRAITVCLCQASQPSPPAPKPTWDSQDSQLFKSPG